jgi:hypothetical protein
LLQIYCQRFSNQVNVTFARSEDAAGFLAHAQSAPFYVCDHLVSLATTGVFSSVLAFSLRLWDFNLSIFI